MRNSGDIDAGGSNSGVEKLGNGNHNDKVTLFFSQPHYISLSNQTFKEPDTKFQSFVI